MDAATVEPVEPIQPHLPHEDFAPTPAQREIDPVAEQYVRIRDQRMDLNKEEIELQGQLYQLLSKHDLPSYGFLDSTGVRRKVEIVSTTKVKVRKDKGGDDEPTLPGTDEDDHDDHDEQDS